MWKNNSGSWYRSSFKPYGPYMGLVRFPPLMVVPEAMLHTWLDCTLSLSETRSLLCPYIAVIATSPDPPGTPTINRNFCTLARLHQQADRAAGAGMHHACSNSPVVRPEFLIDRTLLSPHSPNIILPDLISWAFGAQLQSLHQIRSFYVTILFPLSLSVDNDVLKKTVDNETTEREKKVIVSRKHRKHCLFARN